MELLLKHGASIQAVTEVLHHWATFPFLLDSSFGFRLGFFHFEYFGLFHFMHVCHVPCDVFLVPLQSGLTPIHVAAFMGHENIVHALTHHGASPNTTNVVSRKPSNAQ